jgi:hypothetical protein
VVRGVSVWGADKEGAGKLVDAALLEGNLPRVVRHETSRPPEQCLCLKSTNLVEHLPVDLVHPMAEADVRLVKDALGVGVGG